VSKMNVYTQNCKHS